MERVNNLPIIEWVNLQQHKDKRRAVLFTNPSAEQASNSFIDALNVEKKIYITTADKKSVEKLVRKRVSAEAAYAVGGGRTIDVARYLAKEWGLEIICIPTIISSDAFLVDCTGLRENGCVTYVSSKRADRVLLDWELLQKAPLKYHLSGCGDVLSIYTGLYDWEYVDKQKVARSDELYSLSVATMAKGILNSLLLEAKEIKNGTIKGIEAIVTCLGMEVTLCNFYGNSRPEEGGEHFFTYCIENKVPHFLHGEMVCFGVLITSLLQNQPWRSIKKFMDRVGINYKPVGLKPEIVLEVLREIPEYVTSHNLRFSIYNTLSLYENKQKVDNFLKEIF